MDVTFEITSALSDDGGSWREVVSMGTTGGRLSIHVSIQDIPVVTQPSHRSLRRSPSLSNANGIRTSATGMDAAEDWVHFVPNHRDGATRFRNPVTEHLKTSYESMKAAVVTFAANRVLKKASSFPRSRQTTQTDLPPTGAPPFCTSRKRHMVWTAVQRRPGFMSSCIC